MEEPPDSLEDLQPQDLSTSGRPAVMDQTKTVEERVFNPGPLEGLRVVRGPGWYSNISTGNHTVPFTGSSSSNTSHEAGQHIQPDNAFSHTTVTLSYVSRSHICSNQDSIHPTGLYGVPPKSKHSLHPPCGTEESHGGTGFTGNQTERFLSQANAFNGDVVYGGKSLQEDEDRNQGLHNCQNGHLSSSELCADSSVEDRVSVPEEELEASLDFGGTGGEPCSLSREYMSPLQEPLSPSSTSPDDIHDVFILPLASSSPSTHISSVEPILCDSSSPEETNQSSSDVINKTSTPPEGQEALLQPLNDSTDKVSENNYPTSVTHINGNAQTLRKLPPRVGRGTRLETIVLSITSGRYKRSGSISPSKKPKASLPSVAESSLVDKTNIISSRSVRKKRRNAKYSAKRKTRRKTATPAKSTKSVQSSTDCMRESTSDSERINHRDTLSRGTSPKSLKFTADQRSKTDEHGSPSAPSPRSTPRRSRRKALTPSSPSSTMCKTSKKSEPHLEPPVEILSPSTPPKKSPRKPKQKSPGVKPPPHALKKSPAKKQRKKKSTVSCFSSMFLPREPEIKLKYVNFKEVKRRSRSEVFSPFIHTEPERSSPSVWTVINYPEQEIVSLNKNHQQPRTSRSVPASSVPSTSCLQLGRVSTHGQQQRALICCLCGQSANAMDLGDLHGPYYPEVFQLSSKDQCSSPGQKEESRGHTDSNASVKRRRCCVPPTSLAVRQGAKLKKRRQCSGDGLSSPSTKAARCDGGGGDVDWYSPPVLPLEPCEYWLHEDCGVWSPGVFLVKGRVYGLEEAVRAAQDMVCSACHCVGASLGCCYRGCVHKYHYRCALESDCALIEDNFAMKCSKHKNTPSKGNRWEYG